MRFSLKQLDVVWAFNVFEAVWWMVFGLIIAKFGMRIRGMTHPLKWFFVVILIAASMTEIVECWTGAWWKPPALAVAKGACGFAALFGGWMLYRKRSAKEPNA